MTQLDRIETAVTELKHQVVGYPDNPKDSGLKGRIIALEKNQRSWCKAFWVSIAAAVTAATTAIATALFR